MTTTAPTPAEFLASPSTEEDEAYDDRTPLEQLADLERRVTALTGLIHGGYIELTLPGDQAGAAFAGIESAVDPDERAVIDEALQAAGEELADIRAKHGTVLALVEEIRGIVKPSTSKVSLAVKAAIEGWANPAVPEGSDAPGEPTPETPSPTHSVPGSTEPVIRQGVGEGPQPEQPEHDADVETWRAYARAVHAVPEGTVLEQMNRSQIRTMLGVEQPVGA